MPSFRILTLPPDEWPRYKALRLEALRLAPQAYSSTHADMLTRPDSFWRGRLEDAQAGEHTWLLFTEEDGCLTGIMGAFLEESDPSVARVGSVYVTPEKRGTGTAPALLAALLDTVRARSEARTARLGVNLAQDRAVALYRRAGFREVHTVRARMGDGVEYTESIMELELSPDTDQPPGD